MKQDNDIKERSFQESVNMSALPDISDAEALDYIAQELSRKKWNIDSLYYINEIVRSAGRETYE